MTIRADEEIFALSDEIIDHIDSFFPRSDSHHNRMVQACMALQALINAIGILLCTIDSEYTIKAVEGSFAKMLRDLPEIRAEAQEIHKSQSVH
jgi:hypothetical protein